MSLQVGRQWARRHLNGGGAPAPAKYRNKKVKGFDIDGNTVTFDSVREAKRWGELVAMQKAGKISQLERQVVYHFGGGHKPEHFVRYVGSNRRLKYILDFRYVDNETGELAHEDVKGKATRDFLIKQALMLYFHGIEVLTV